MTRKLTASLTLFEHRHKRFAFSNKRRSHSVTVGVGGNIGDVSRRFTHLLFFLQRDTQLSIHAISPILKNPPFGYTQQEDFYNAVIHVSTHLSPRACLKHLLAIEKKFGRKRSFQDAPRTLDLDMIFFDDVVMNHKDLTLPHPGWWQRDSVLIPLSLI